MQLRKAIKNCTLKLGTVESYYYPRKEMGWEEQIMEPRERRAMGCHIGGVMLQLRDTVSPWWPCRERSWEKHPEHRAEKGRVGLEGPVHGQDQGAWGPNAEEEESRVTQVCGIGVGGRWRCDVLRQRQREKKSGHL